MRPEVHVSITGLRLRRPWPAPAFGVHAIRAMAQARAAPGAIAASARTIDGVHHTLSVWTGRAAMRAHLTTGAHLAAMRRFPGIATGETVGFAAREIPDWSDVPAIRRERGCVA